MPNMNHRRVIVSQRDNCNVDMMILSTCSGTPSAIGVMKAIGAPRLKIFAIYVGIAVAYGVVGTTIGILLAIPAQSWMVAGQFLTRAF
jgi:hypothetical protein